MGKLEKNITSIGIVFFYNEDHLSIEPVSFLYTNLWGWRKDNIPKHTFVGICSVYVQYMFRVWFLLFMGYHLFNQRKYQSLGTHMMRFTPYWGRSIRFDTIWKSNMPIDVCSFQFSSMIVYVCINIYIYMFGSLFPFSSFSVSMLCIYIYTLVGQKLRLFSCRQ